MLYLTCTMIFSVDLAHYGVPRAKHWVSVDCGTICDIYIFSIFVKTHPKIILKSFRVNIRTLSIATHCSRILSIFTEFTKFGKAWEEAKVIDVSGYNCK